MKDVGDTDGGARCRDDSDEGFADLYVQPPNLLILLGVVMAETLALPTACPLARRSSRTYQHRVSEDPVLEAMREQAGPKQGATVDALQKAPATSSMRCEIRRPQSRFGRKS